MTRSFTSYACLASALVLAGCGDVPIGDDSTRHDGSPDQAPSDSPPETATCSGANPAEQLCRKAANDCIPSSCTCTDGAWHCTADCRVAVPLCADGGASDLAPDVAPDVALDVAPDVAPDAAPDSATCSGANPAAQLCRKTANDCIPSSCTCTDGSWRCTADCPVNVPLCADAGTTDLAPDLGSGRPSNEQSCINAINVPGCEISRPSAVVTRAAGAPLLARIEVLSGPCGSVSCSSGCQSLGVVGNSLASAGSACLVQVIATDGRSQTLALSVEGTTMPFTCCGYPTDGHGVWAAPTLLTFSPSTAIVDFGADGGAGGGDPCANCSAAEVCVQSFAGKCGAQSVTCRAVSETCRTKLSASGAKSCKSIPECESELCMTPSYRCVQDPACGTEAPQAQVYCYGI